jgi:hypothetical protein
VGFRASIALVLLTVCACAPSEGRAPDVPVVAAAPSPESEPAPVCEQPAYFRPAIAPTCTDFTLRGGQSFHDQLTLQLSSGATTRIDCPRMRLFGQDTPVCVAKVVAGQMRGACCPPGHTDPTDPTCVGEGSVDEMYKRQRVWEWCSRTEAQSRACEPCVWVTGAAR